MGHSLAFALAVLTALPCSAAVPRVRLSGSAALNTGAPVTLPRLAAGIGAANKLPSFSPLPLLAPGLNAPAAEAVIGVQQGLESMGARLQDSQPGERPALLGQVFDGGRDKPAEVSVSDPLSQWLPSISARGPPQSPQEHERIQRARRAAIKGKKFLIVGGAAYPEKHTIFELGKELGVEMTVLDADTAKIKHLIKDSVIVSLEDPAKAVPEAKEKLDAYIKEHGGFDGIVTFWEDEVPITAALAEHLRLPYHSAAAVTAARSKGNTRQAMKDAGLETPDFHVLKSRDDLEQALETASYPMILKPAFGIEAMSVVKVHDAEEARSAYEKIYKEIDPKNDPIYNQGRDIVFEEYFDGDEVDVDILLQNGRVVFQSVTDNWPTVEPYFIPKGSTLPSRLPRGKQQEMLELAVESARALGFTDGVLHIEGKYTSRGPRLLEVNARMGGLWVRDWVKAVWGVDMAEEQFFVSAGIPIAPRKSPEPLKHLFGEFFLPPFSGVFEGIDAAELKEMAGFYNLLVFKEPGQEVLVPPEGYQRLGMISAQGLTSARAEALFKALRKKLAPRVRRLE